MLFCILSSLEHTCKDVLEALQQAHFKILGKKITSNISENTKTLSCNPFHAAAKNHLAKHVFALVHQTVSNALRSVSV